MNDAFAFLMVGLTVCFLCFMGGGVVGTNIENNRLYDKCLSNNTTMVYSEVVAMCKNQVK